ncbi:thiol-disulfide oxidoreductase DCC family protein [Pontibacillus yanchengensis]|uniref:Thiol-disulfide oxidoreductase n=1 Tax=Pontibacillus yanchengensis Y32 TaxID=1385514 RepID=A0A0A2TCX2_9BACI|nr:thiol-disulfide oxidoreductase DCC family protein [Pontibacillus yanchengensis]KGP73359.1 thiol-disulfide oxidoreductase [Pontibacillus yanchengensis Y32]
MANKIILFDGECNFCDASVQFILKRDRQEQFTFASLQGEHGQKLLKQHGIASSVDSFVLVDGNQIHFQSTAALNVCKELAGAWKLLYGFIVIPKPIRDKVYKIVANNRYKWFGKKEQCALPSPETRKRFLD